SAGHHVEGRTKRTNVAGQGQEFQARDAGSVPASSDGLPLPPPRYQSSRKPGYHPATAPEDHSDARLLLAPAPGLPPDNDSREQQRVLAEKIQGEHRTRPAECPGLASAWLGRTRGLGMRDDGPSDSQEDPRALPGCKLVGQVSRDW